MSTESDPNSVLQELENAKQVYSGGNYAAAEPLLREVFEKIAHLPHEMAYCTEGLSEIYNAWGKFSEAIKLNQRLINLTATNPGQSLDAIGGALERIAAISLKVGKPEQSEKLSRLAAAVKAGKVDVATLVTDKGKVPMAPPTTEHTFTFRAIGADAPPPGADATGMPTLPQAPPSAPPSPQVSQSQQVTPAPQASSALPTPSIPAPPNQMPPKPPVPKPDPLGTPIKETAMFSRPNISALNNVAPSAPPGSPSPAPNVPQVTPNPFAAPGAPLAAPNVSPPSLNLPNAADIPAHQLADFDEEVPVDSSYLSGSHAPVPVAPPQPPQEQPQIQPQEASEEISPETTEEWGGADDWGPIESSDASETLPEAQPTFIEQNAGTPQSPFAQYPTPQAPAPQFAAQQDPASQFPQPPSPLAPQTAPASSPPAQTFGAPSPAQPPSLPAPKVSSLPAASFPEPAQHSEMHDDLSVQSQSESSSSQSASSMRSMRSMSSRNMEAPPVMSGPDMGGIMGMLASFFVGKRSLDQPVQQLEDPGSSSAKAAGVLVLVAFIVLGGISSLYKLAPRKLTADQAFLATQHRYISADSAERFTLLDAATCEFAIGDSKMKTSLRFYLDDWRDAVDMALGRAGQKQFLMYKKDDGVVDQDETKFYLHGGPEIQLANKVEILNQYATIQYTRTKKYPESGDLNGAADLSYQNPYTKKREVPSFHRLLVGKGIRVSLDADEARTKFYIDLLAGGIPKDTPKAHPGEIRCYVVDFLSPRGDIQGFVVQLIGKDGKPVSSAVPRKCFLFALEDGKEYKPCQPPQLPFNGNGGLRPVTVWLLMDKLDPTFMLVLTAGPAIVFTALAFVFLIMAFAIPKGFGRFVAWIFVVASAIPALLFIMVKVFP
jgi:hypothetical protein